jgi:D-glycero-alpha-D-manno-heptose-7-phosphate kinase
MASVVAQSYVDVIEERRRQLRIIKDLVEEGIAILNSGQDITAFGRLLHEGWQAKRDLSSKVSNPQVDTLYEKALSAGAIGGKLTGAGGGGFLLLFAPPAAHESLKKVFSGLIYVPFKFEFGGSQIIFFDPEEDYSALDMAPMGQPGRLFEENKE